MRTILAASALSLAIALLGTPLWIRLVRRLGYGQMIREEGPQAHLGKRGTPTMGGTVFIVAAIVAYALGHLATTTRPTVSGMLVLLLMAGLGIVGFVDDYIKVFKQRSLGLRSGAKMIGIIMKGYTARESEGYPAMPAIGVLNKLSAAQIQAIINHERTSWGNHAREIPLDEVEAVLGKLTP